MTTQESPLTVHVFGKPGCAKCSMLNRRLDKMLAEEPRYARFHKEYHNVLEEDGLVERHQYDEMSVRVEYSLTEKARSLVPILMELKDWGAANL